MSASLSPHASCNMCVVGGGRGGEGRAGLTTIGMRGSGGYVSNVCVIVKFLLNARANVKDSRVEQTYVRIIVKLLNA